MSFETPNQPFSVSELAMIDRVLAEAGYRGTPAEVDSAATSQAAQFLIQRFLEGVTSEEGLTDALARRGRESIPGDETPMQVKEQPLTDGMTRAAAQDERTLHAHQNDRESACFST